mmetsp:Transcript_64903/g.107708  ORF Transcript_64903/g.107708 Transcript_64903/m.107708 type:complete len:218 (+) Transcript_64903:1004-1657(+)
MGENGRFGDVVEALQLPRRVAEEALNKVIQGSHRHQQHRQNRVDANDSDEGGHEAERDAHHLIEGVGQQHIHVLDVVGEPVDDAAHGRDVEEGHGAARDTAQHVPMQLRGRPDRGHRLADVREPGDEGACQSDGREDAQVPSHAVRPPGGGPVRQEHPGAHVAEAGRDLPRQEQHGPHRPCRLEVGHVHGPAHGPDLALLRLDQFALVCFGFFVSAL